MALLMGSNFQVAAQKAKRFVFTENKQEKRVNVTIEGKSFTSYVYPDILKKPVLFPIRTRTK